MGKEEWSKKRKARPIERGSNEERRRLEQASCGLEWSLIPPGDEAAGLF